MKFFPSIPNFIIGLAAIANLSNYQALKTVSITITYQPIEFGIYKLIDTAILIYIWDQSNQYYFDKKTDLIIIVTVTKQFATNIIPIAVIIWNTDGYIRKSLLIVMGVTFLPL